MTDTLLKTEPLTLAQGDAEIAAAMRLARRWAALRADTLADLLGDIDPIDELLELIHLRTVVSITGAAAAEALSDAIERALAEHRTLIDVPVYETVKGRKVRVRAHTVEQYDAQGQTLLGHSVEIARLGGALDDALDWIVARTATADGGRRPTRR